MAIVFLVRLSIDLNSTLIQFMEAAEYLSSDTARVFIAEMLLLNYLLDRIRAIVEYARLKDNWSCD